MSFLNLLFGSKNTAQIEAYKANDAIVLDVRTNAEFSSGHVPNSINIPLQEIEKATKKLDKQKPIIVVCRSGNRSAMAVQYLKQFGFDVIDGGAWNNLL